MKSIGFRNADVAAGLNDSLLVRHHRMGRHRDDRDMTKFWFLPNPFGQEESILQAKLYIKQDSVRQHIFNEAAKPASQILYRLYLETFCLEPVRQQLTIGLIVFDNLK